jgi:hypothetical protein
MLTRARALNSPDPPAAGLGVPLGPVNGSPGRPGGGCGAWPCGPRPGEELPEFARFYARQSGPDNDLFAGAPAGLEARWRHGGTKAQVFAGPMSRRT